ncbi:MAG: hypothetical protein KDB27_20185, partial [Planctomycetales bacterium]|nr:hypothetical protein [Planctomycetales bacterium]
CADSQFSGEFDASCNLDRWQVNAKCFRWDGLDGKRLIGIEHLPVRVDGQFSLDQCEFHYADRRFESIAGRLNGSNGAMPPELLRRIHAIGFRYDPKWDGAFKQFQMQFSVSAAGFRFETDVGQKYLHVPANPILVRDLVAVLATPENKRSVEVAESLRHRLPLDRLQLGDSRRTDSAARK